MFTGSSIKFINKSWLWRLITQAHTMTQKQEMSKFV